MHLRAAKYSIPEGLEFSPGNNNNLHQFTANEPLYSPINPNQNKRSRSSGFKMAIESRSKEFICSLESLPIRQHCKSTLVDGSGSNNNNIAPINSSKHDKMKLLEVSIINFVESSSLAAEEAKFELALERARQALEAMNQLKAVMMQDNSRQVAISMSSSSSSSSSNHNIYSDATDNNIKSNPMTTATSLFELAIMVNSNLAAQFRNNNLLGESIELYTDLCKMANSRGANLSGSASQHLYDSRFLLYRFGLNIGNLLYEMHDHQRALKYYRLTLDRLASSGQLALKLKLMNNISLTLLAMKNHSDAIQSMNLLLADNLSRTTTSELEALNANHHRFGLNLMCCHYQRADLSAMMDTLRALVRVSLSGQLAQVNLAKADGRVVFPAATSASHAGELNSALARDIGETSSDALNKLTSVKALRPAQQPIITQTSANKGDWAAESDRRVLDGNSASLLPVDTNSDKNLYTASGAQQRTASVLSDPADGQQGCRAISQAAGGLSVVEKRRQLMSTIQEDRLEALIGKKRDQVARSLITSCNLMLELEDNLNRSEPKQTSVSVYDFCLKLLASSETYKSLVSDLRTNIVGAMLERRNIDSAIKVLEEIHMNVQVEDQKPSLSGLKLSPSERLSNSSVSSMVANNRCLLNLLRKQTTEAIVYADKALTADPSNVNTWINLANCQYNLNNLSLAHTYLQRALLKEPNNWTVNYNLALLARKLGLHYDELKANTKSSLLKDQQCLSFLAQRKMVLSSIQLAMIYRESGKYQQSSVILGDLITNFKQAPEVFLIASQVRSELGNENNSDMSTLLEANREHPYHLPTLERLIALNISNFNYESAKGLLLSCIKNRPDQVKWYQMLAECHRHTAEYGKAMNLYKAAIEAFPRDTSCLRALIKLTEELGLANECESLKAKLAKTLRLSGRDRQTSAL